MNRIELVTIVQEQMDLSKRQKSDAQLSAILVMLIEPLNRRQILDVE